MSPQTRTSEEKQLAEALCRSLRRWHLDAATEGQGHNWKVRIGTRGNRTAVIHYLFYSADLGLVLGLNPGNARSRLGPPMSWEAGPEYLVELTEVGDTVEGRCSDRRSVVYAVRRWCRNALLDSVVGKAPFIDQAGRSLRSVTRQLDPSLEWEMIGNPERGFGSPGFEAMRSTFRRKGGWLLISFGASPGGV